MKKQSVLQILTKNGTKYQFGSEKTVEEVLLEIGNTESLFYIVTHSCAIKADEIVSVETFEVDLEQVEDEKEADVE